MTDDLAAEFGIEVSVHSEHGLLHGKLAPQADARGMVVLAHDMQSLDARDNFLAGLFRQAGFATLSVDLIARQEEHFPDIHHNVSLMARRLLDFLGLIKGRMQLGESPPLPFGLFAANATTPVAVRVAALRDHDIAAVVCRGGLIDLAGVLYLHSLESPLLMLAAEGDSLHIASVQRAFAQISCPRELQLIPDIGADRSSSAGFEALAREANRWFDLHFSKATTVLA